MLDFIFFQLSVLQNGEFSILDFPGVSGLPKGYRMTSSDLGAESRSTELFPGSTEDTLGLLTFSS